MCVFVLECYRCACGMKERREEGMEGWTEGKERRWRGFRKSAPNKVKLFQSSSFCSYCLDLCCPTYNKSLLSFTLPSCLGCRYLTLSLHLWAFCWAVFPPSPSACTLFSPFCRSSSPNGVYIGSRDRLGSSFLPLPSLPVLYFLQYHSPQ